MISFKATPQEQKHIAAIVDRAMDISARKRLGLDRMSVEMDITAVHANGCPLKLSDLETAQAFDFAHDVFGIVGHIDRTTGKLTRCFVPRYAKREAN